MANRDLNQDNLEAFHQELTEANVVRSKRRSSILKPVDNQLPEDRRQSRRISFHNNILCQQILPDGTTQVVTEALKAKIPDSSASTASIDSRPSLPDKTDEENVNRKRSAVGPVTTSAVSGLKKRKDPKITAQQYQNFILRNYNAADENDYDTVFNTSVNRNGYPVAPREQHLDMTKLFAVDHSDGVMDITKMNCSQVQDENDITGVHTKVFSDMSMSLDLDDSLNDLGNVSEMDTAMIGIDDDLFDDSDEKEAAIRISPTKRVAVEMEQTLPADANSLHIEAENVQSAPVPTVVIVDQESIINVSMSIVSDHSRNGSPPGSTEKTKVFENMGMEVTEAVNVADKVVEEQERTQVFSQNASISLEKNSSKDISPPSSQQTTDPLPLPSSQIDHQKDEELFQDKSTSFRNNRALSLAFSRVSFPRNLDKVLKLRREQMNKTLQTLKDADISSEIESYSESPDCGLNVGHDSSIASMHFPDKSSIVFEQTSQIQQQRAEEQDKDTSGQTEEKVESEETIETESRTFTDESSQHEATPRQEETHVSPETESSNFLNSSSRLPSQNSDQGSDAVTSKQPTGSTSNFLSLSHDIDSFDISCNDVEMSYLEQSMEVDSPVMATGEEEEEDGEEGQGLHEDSLFEIYHSIDSSFHISPDSSFHSSFVCHDDTLLVLGDDIEAKINEFILSAGLEREEAVDNEALAAASKDRTYISLTKFDADRNGAVLCTENPDQLVVTFMYGTIEFTVDLGATVRSFNCIPIKAIRRICINSLANSTDFVVQDDCRSLINYSDEKMKGLFVIAHDMLISTFEEQKSSLISQYSTSDQLCDLLADISDLVKVSREFLQELALTSLLYPMQLYRKVGKVYDLAFQLPGRRRNFFLILAIDPSLYPFTPLKVRFGFDRGDRILYHVNTFAKSLSIVVKPGKHYMTRMIDAAKKYVLISRKISRSER